MLISLADPSMLRVFRLVVAALAVLSTPPSWGGLVRLQEGATFFEDAAASIGGVLVYGGNELNGGEVWRSDGTLAGTFLVRDLQSEGAWTPRKFVAAGNLVFFGTMGTNAGVWRTDGTAGGTFRLGGDSLSGPTLAVDGSTAYFFTSEGSSGGQFALWRSDGTIIGTVKVSSTLRSSDTTFARAGATVLFANDDGVHGRELWKSDGTEAGTSMVRDLFPGVDGSFPFAFASVNGVAVFIARPDINSYQVWRSDGTPAGTYPVSQFVDNNGPRDPAQVGPVVGGALFFTGGTAPAGMELWRSDGTVAGTYMVTDLRQGDSSSFPGVFGAEGGLLHFRASDAEGTRYWRSNGTVAGTWPVTAPFPTGVNPDRAIGGSSGRFYFDGYDIQSRKSIWSTDGTPFAAREDVPSRTDTQFVWARANPSGLFFAVSVQGQRSLWFLSTRDTGGDVDEDGIPNQVEAQEGRDPFTKDNDIFTSARLFAMQQYRDFLGREGDSGGVSFWTGQLSGGGQTRAQMVDTFFNSPEFQAMGAPMVRLYFAYFLRIPDYGGLTYWTNRFRAGESLEGISDLFAGSPEFGGRYGSLDNAGFVDRVYRNVLGRAPDSGGLAYWKGRLDAGMTRGQMMVAFSESPEYRSLITHEVYVTMLYVGMLRRAPDAGGFSSWVSYLDAGNPGPALIQLFLDSAEYRARFLP
jgi:ELWxxDGT repeat protein